MNNTLGDFVEKADMPQEEEREPVISCDICGKDLLDDDTAIAITTGDISAVDGGFMSNETPWLYVAYSECGAKITDAVEKIIDYLGNAKKEGLCK